MAVVGRAPLILDYEINAAAVYSDGKPITCDDMELAWASQSGKFPMFDAASRAGYTDIATVDCAPGQKKARVSFAPERAFTDYGQLFTATSMMPSAVKSRPATRSRTWLPAVSAPVTHRVPSTTRGSTR